MMQNSVANGWSTISPLSHRLRTSGSATSIAQTDQPMCMLGIAAYWFEMFLSVPESNDQNVG